MTYIESRIGGRSENQDFYGTAQTHYGELIVVCDGMGGHNGGRHAAEVAVQIIKDEVSKSEDTNPVNALHAAITKANADIWKQSHANINLKGMGTTVVALLLTPEKAISCHVGDSRIYQLRKGEILHRTFDHSHVFEMVKAGLITEEQARLSEKSNIITRGLGIRATVDIEITDNLSYKKGDRFLLCTDGICGAVPENELVELVSQKGNIQLLLKNLVEQVDEVGKTNGGNHDNLTAAMIELETDSSFQQVEQRQVIASQPKSRGKQLVYLLLILLICLLAFNLYFNSHRKKQNKIIEKNIKIKQTSNVNSKTVDTTSIIPIKK